MLYLLFLEVGRTLTILYLIHSSPICNVLILQVLNMFRRT